MNERYHALLERISHLRKLKQNFIENASSGETRTRSSLDQVSKLETKYNTVKDLYDNSKERYEKKQQVLREHVEHLKRLVEEEKKSIDEIKQTSIDKLNKLEENVKDLIAKERIRNEEQRKVIQDKIKAMTTMYDNEMTRKELEYKDIIKQTKDNVELDMNSVAWRLNEDKNKTASLDDLMKDMASDFIKVKDIIETESRIRSDFYTKGTITISLREKAKEVFERETVRKQEFEERILKLLEETTEKLKEL